MNCSEWTMSGLHSLILWKGYGRISTTIIGIQPNIQPDIKYYKIFADYVRIFNLLT
ncbi:MAG: hypothetical protein ACFCUU_04870 [Cyclobacteriaceae bacterium]